MPHPVPPAVPRTEAPDTAPSGARTPGPAPIWTPDPADVAASPFGRFSRFVHERHDLGLTGEDDYATLWRWSTDQIEEYWEAVWDFFAIPSHSPWEQVLDAPRMPGARWFSGATLNYAEVLLSHGEDDAEALIALREDGTRTALTWGQLRQRTAELAAALRRLGVQQGDRVVGVLPAGPHAVIGLLATASIGAVWAQCAPDLSAPAILDRFAQLRPRVLIATDEAHHKGRRKDRSTTVDEVRAQLPDLLATVLVAPSADRETSAEAVHRWDDLLTSETGAGPEPEYVALPFDHPLWILFSSGTTGVPKGIVHSHGGIVVALLPALSLHLDIRATDRFFWYSATTWVMWNVSVSALLTGATVVVYDGSPLHPDSSRLWRIAADERATHLGTGPGVLLASERDGLRPGSQFDLSALRIIGSTGSPLPAASYRWVRDAVGPHIHLSSLTGGTDAVVAFAGSAPATPVWPGEISARTLGVAMESWSPDGEPQTDAVGELVITQPIPSMPLTLWDDPDGSRLRAAYFDDYPGVWRHGDWVTVTSRGSVLMHGRSDATLNRNGVRLGSAEIYAAVDRIPQIEDSVVVGIEQPDGGYWMPLFVQLTADADPTEDWAGRVRETIRHRASPRHVPDEVIPVPAVPRTRTGKRVEVPLKRILLGARAEDVVSVHALEDPESLAPFIAIARERARTALPRTS